MILLLGLFLWIAAFAVAFRLLWIARLSWLRGASALAIAALMTAGGAALLFRPHEDIFGGEDPGSYINSSFTYARTGSFFHVDPLLSKAPSEARSEFFYGHKYFGRTKDACLWVRDVEQSLIGPRFLPAYPLLMSTLVKFLPGIISLYVAPFFALLTVLAIAAVAGLIFPGSRIAPLAAAFLYMLSPLVIWHGRCPRAEMPASFFLLAGAALLLHAWHSKRWQAWVDVILAGLCMGLAPFFHPSAWMPVLTITCLLLATILFAGRDDLAAFLPIPAMMFFLFVFQQSRINDAYRVLRHMAVLLEHPVLSFAALLVASLIPWGLASIIRRHLKETIEKPWQLSRKAEWIMRGSVIAVSLLAILLLCLMRNELAHLLPRPISYYFVPADYATFAGIISVPIACLALLGWGLCMMDTSSPCIERACMAMAVLPSLCLTGLVVDFMSTRYYILAIVPVAALCLAGLPVMLERLNLLRWKWPLLPMLLLLALGSLQLHGRMHLATLTEYRGFYSFLQKAAAPLQKNNAILLAEYSRLSAPFDHIFGIPTLGLDQERRDSYETALQAWEFILRNSEGLTPFFMTPFQPPAGSRFVFEPAGTFSFAAERLLQARLHLPKRVRQYALTLNLYRMRLRIVPGEIPAHITLPYAMAQAEGNMGLRGFGPTLHKQWFIPALQLETNRPVAFNFPDTSGDPGSTPREGLILLHAPSNNSCPQPPRLNFAGPIDAYREQWSALPGGWWAFQFAGEKPMPGRSFEVQARSPMALANVFFLHESTLLPAFPSDPEIRLAKIPLGLESARWTRQNSSFFVPAAGKAPAIFLALLAPPPKRDFSTLFTIANNTAPLMPPLNVTPEIWQWQAGLLPAGALESDIWMRTQAQPSWDPGESKYPSDLGPLMAMFALLPRLYPEPDFQHNITSLNHSQFPKNQHMLNFATQREEQ